MKQKDSSRFWLGNIAFLLVFLSKTVSHVGMKTSTGVPPASGLETGGAEEKLWLGDKQKKQTKENQAVADSRCFVR